jgi:hypothetical protein
MDDSTLRFPFRFTPSYAVAARLFGITPDRSEVVVGDGVLRARFGPWHVQTPLSNITGVELQGPYAYVKTAGPPHLTFSDRGLTFASNGDRGVFVELREKVPGLSPFGAPKHPNLTLTVRDCDGLAAALRAR